MEQYTLPSDAAYRIESRNGLYVAEYLPDDNGWMSGSFQGRILDDVARQEFAHAVMDSIEQVEPAEMQFSTCTDGRNRLPLEDGETAPVREQLVGADVMTLFAMAEALGPRFYANPDAPVEARLEEVIDFAKENGLMVSTHISCGAAGGFVPVTQNAADFSADAQYRRRQERLVPANAYDAGLRTMLTEGYRQRLANGAYEGYSDSIVTGLVRQKIGAHAIGVYLDDGRGVHGHVESAIVRLRLKGYALNPNKLQELTKDNVIKGDQAFGVNDYRLSELAELMGRGHDQDYKLAYMAGEDFTDAGHGTLAKPLPTLVVSRVAQEV